jgi:hypothetical protein
MCIQRRLRIASVSIRTVSRFSVPVVFTTSTEHRDTHEQTARHRREKIEIEHSVYCCVEKGRKSNGIPVGENL